VMSKSKLIASTLEILYITRILSTVARLKLRKVTVYSLSSKTFLCFHRHLFAIIFTLKDFLFIKRVQNILFLPILTLLFERKYEQHKESIIFFCMQLVMEIKVSSKEYFLTIRSITKIFSIL
jgi:hypothetical protein